MDGAGRARCARAERRDARLSLGQPRLRQGGSEAHLHRESTAGTFVDVDKSGGPSVGDEFVFQSDLLDPDTNAKVGSVEGHCMLITESGDVNDCEASGTMEGGQVAWPEGALLDEEVTVLAVVGGTGIFRNVSGQITVETIDDRLPRTRWN